MRPRIAWSSGLGERIEAWAGDMTAPHLGAEAYDLVWCEPAMHRAYGHTYGYALFVARRAAEEGSAR